jgi:hypothetical protein
MCSTVASESLCPALWIVDDKRVKQQNLSVDNVSINKPLESRHRGIVTPFLLKIHVNKMQTHTRNAKP